VKYTVITTFNSQGYKQYGQRMIQTFLEHWPKEVDLVVYAENCTVLESSKNLHVLDLNTSCPELVTFKNTWGAVSKANGDVSADPVRNKRRDAGKGFKWDAVRFAHKVYAVFHAAKNYDSNWLIWMDADMVCHSKMSLQMLDTLCVPTVDLCFLGRENKYSECGLYALNLRSTQTKIFLSKFQEYYDNAESGIFSLAEWHDSFVFDQIRRLVSLRELNWSAGIIRGEGHPLINSPWGAYLDHLKGSRKDAGRSYAKDLVCSRTESYWQ